MLEYLVLMSGHFWYLLLLYIIIFRVLFFSIQTSKYRDCYLLLLESHCQCFSFCPGRSYLFDARALIEQKKFVLTFKSSKIYNTLRYETFQFLLISILLSCLRFKRTLRLKFSNVACCFNGCIIFLSLLPNKYQSRSCCLLIVKRQP